MTRDEHIAWTKARALAYVESDDLLNAFSSLCSDLTKHPETQGHPASGIGMRMMMGGLLGTPEAMRTFIEGVR